MKIRRGCVRFWTALAMLLTFSSARTAFSQDTHYWNNQYGPRSMLLSGAVVGSIYDMSATYYNPGILGYIDEPELLLSANIYQASTLTVHDGAGKGIDLSVSEFNLLPNMLAGAFRGTWLGNNKLAYSLLTRYRFDAELQGTRIGPAEVLPGSMGSEEFAGAIDAGLKVNELWAGITWARPLVPRIGVGITQYFSIRDMDLRNQFFAQALSDTGDVALAFDVDTRSANSYSLLWKAGVGIDLRPLTLGLTLTTPNVQLSGSGNAVINMTRINLDVDGDSIPEDSFESNIQEGAPANYNSPLSIGLGAALHFTKIRLHASAEWFDEVDGYDVLELDPYRAQSSGEVVHPTLRDQSASVVNFGAGLELLGNGYAGYLSFSTDRSSRDPVSDVSLTGYDIYHATLGGTFGVGKSKFMLGLSYAWGSELREQPIDLDPDEDESVIDPGDVTEFSYRRFTFMLGFSVNI